MSEEPEFVPLSIEELQVYFPQYEILSFIAAGGMGAVYLANQKSIDRKVAIKVLPQEMSSDENFSAQFRAEAKVMSRVNHPNLVGFFDFGEVAGMLFIVMEFVDGKSLHHSAHGETIDPNIALDIVIGISEGVEHAHDAGILHRDIKPANILLDQKATPKLGDFGLARPVEESEAGKVIFGTPGYTAPEVVANPESIDERADIFSIGAILYELLTGHLPKDDYTPPSKGTEMHKDFDKIVKKAILPDPDLRYPDMASFLEDLKNLKTKLDSGEVEELKVPKESNKPKPRATVLLAGASPRKEVKLSTGSGNSSKAAAKPLAVKSGAKNSSPRSAAANEKLQKEKKAKAEKSKLINIAITGVIVALAGIFIFSKTLQGKKAAEEAQNTEPAEVEVMPEVEKPAVEAPEIAELTSIQKLDKVAEKLKNGDFSQLPEGAITIDSRAYLFYDEPQTWMNAQREAARYGGYLACPSTVALTERYLVEMEKEGCDEIWTGGGTSGRLQMSWIDGKKWHFKSFKPSEYGALSMDKDGAFKISPPQEAKQFYICWDLEGEQLGAIPNQLKRIQVAAKENNMELLPPGSFIEDDAVYFVYSRRAIYKEAVRIGKNYGAEIATPLTDSLYQKMCLAVSLTLREDAAAWVRGKIMKDGTVNWEAKLNNQQVWLEQLAPGDKVLGIRLMNKQQPGLMNLDKLKGAEAMILKWDIVK